MTWMDIKKTVLHKMFLLSSEAFAIDDVTAPYLASMPAVANEALALLATAGKFICKYIDIDATCGKSYDLRTLAADFYRVAPDQVLNTSGRTTDFRIDGARFITFEVSGKFRVFYYAYPGEITVNTDDNYVLPLDFELAPLLPLYIASELYRDDDPSVAAGYRNEFELARGALTPNPDLGKLQFESESGW
ncbi:MAG: hypothetical protein RSA70_05015 [Clostridia bacterium]